MYWRKHKLYNHVMTIHKSKRTVIKQPKQTEVASKEISNAKSIKSLMNINEEKFCAQHETM